ncbi:MAG: hypothetical protein ACR2H9_16200 [Longimicrobiaceae bacterium]
MMFMFTALFWLIVLGILARWVFAPTGRVLPEQTQRLELEMSRMREELERLAAHVERLQDEQSFMVRLLSESDQRLLEEGREERRTPLPRPSNPLDSQPGDLR